jgi:hypothetical protein
MPDVPQDSLFSFPSVLFPDDLSVVSDEQGESFHYDVSIMGQCC